MVDAVSGVVERRVGYPQTPLTGARAAVADSRGNIFVATAKGVIRVAPDGQAQTIAPDIEAPQGLVWLNANTLLATDARTGALWRVSVAANSVVRLTGGFVSPDGVAVEPGRCTALVVDAASGTLSRINVRTGKLLAAGGGLPFKPASGRPTHKPAFRRDVAVLPSRQILVSDDTGGVIFEVAFAARR